MQKVFFRKNIIHESDKIREVLEKTILYLKNNARRDSIKRDKKSGRSELGVNSLYGPYIHRH